MSLAKGTAPQVQTHAKVAPALLVLLAFLAFVLAIAAATPARAHAADRNSLLMIPSIQAAIADEVSNASAPSGTALRSEAADMSAAADGDTQPEATTYGLWVAGTQVTDRSVSDILGDGTVSYDPDANVLTLNGYHYTVGSGEQAMRGALQIDASMTVELVGENTISSGDFTICQMPAVCRRLE